MQSDKLLSQTIHFLRFPLIFSVVLSHTDFIGVATNGMAAIQKGAYPIYDFVHQLVKGEFASQKLEDIAAHEFGHIFSAKKGNIGIDISRKAHYNIFGEDITVNEMLEYLDSEISQYSTTYYENGNNRKHKFDVKRYREVIPEIFARDNSCPNDFTEEFVKLLKEV